MKYIFMLLFCFFLFLNNFAFAAENVAEPVIVTAGRITENVNTVPHSVTVIDEEALEKNQYEDLYTLLQAYGFGMDSYGPGQTSSQVSIRGMSSNYSNPLDSNVLVVVNGSPIATTNLSEIPVTGIERIEILRGPGAVQYGSSAVGGVINVMPRGGTEKFCVTTEGGYGTWHNIRALGSISGKIKKIDFAGSINWNGQSNNYITGAGKLYQDTYAKGRLGYLMNAGLEITEENRINAIILGAQDLDWAFHSRLLMSKNITEWM